MSKCQEVITFNKNKKKSIKIDVTDEEYNLILNQATKLNFSIRRYVKTCVLDSITGQDTNNEMRHRQIIQHLPKLYHEIERIEDQYIKNNMKEGVGVIWQLLR